MRRRYPHVRTAAGVLAGLAAAAAAVAGVVMAGTARPAPEWAEIWTVAVLGVAGVALIAYGIKRGRL